MSVLQVFVEHLFMTPVVLRAGGTAGNEMSIPASTMELRCGWHTTDSKQTHVSFPVPLTTVEMILLRTHGRVCRKLSKSESTECELSFPLLIIANNIKMTYHKLQPDAVHLFLFVFRRMEKIDPGSPGMRKQKLNVLECLGLGEEPSSGSLPAFLRGPYTCVERGLTKDGL